MYSFINYVYFQNQWCWVFLQHTVSSDVSSFIWQGWKDIFYEFFKNYELLIILEFPRKIPYYQWNTTKKSHSIWNLHFFFGYNSIQCAVTFCKIIFLKKVFLCLKIIKNKYYVFLNSLFTQDIAAAQGDWTLFVRNIVGLFFDLKLNLCLKLKYKHMSLKYSEWFNMD